MLDVGYGAEFFPDLVSFDDRMIHLAGCETMLSSARCIAASPDFSSAFEAKQSRVRRGMPYRWLQPNVGEKSVIG